MPIGNINALKPGNQDFWDAHDPSGSANPPPEEPSGPLEPGERAAPGRAGYLGAPEALVVIPLLGSLVGTPLEGIANWDGESLRLDGSDVVVDGVDVTANSVYHGSGVNVTIQNSIVRCTAPATYGIGQANGETQGVFTIQDTTLICEEGVTYGFKGEGISYFLRNDVSGSFDGIHACGNPDSSEDASVIEQNVIHDLSRAADDHCDGIQTFNTTASNTTEDTFITIKGNYIDGQEIGVAGECVNASVAVGGGTTPSITPIVDNNYFGGGAYHLRVEGEVINALVTNNNFGVLRPDAPVNEFGLASVDADTVDTWDNNRTGSGLSGTGTIVENPNP